MRFLLSLCLFTVFSSQVLAVSNENQPVKEFVYYEKAESYYTSATKIIRLTEPNLSRLLKKKGERQYNLAKEKCKVKEIPENWNPAPKIISAKKTGSRWKKAKLYAWEIEAKVQCPKSRSYLFTNSQSSQKSTKASKSQPRTSNSKSIRPSNKKKRPPRLTPVFVQKENVNSWKTEKAACKYAKNKAIRIAKARCKDDHNGQVATKDDIGIPIDANCQSYRQITKSSLTKMKGQWVTTGNVILQCRLPD